MMTDDLLERGLGALGEEYDVPPHAVDDILDQLRPAQAAEPDDDDVVATHRRWPPTRRTWLLSSAAALVVLVVVAFAVGGSGPSGTHYAAVKNASNADTNAAAAGGGSYTGRAPGPASVPAMPQPAPASVEALSAGPTGAVVGQAPGQPRSADSSSSAGARLDSLLKIEQTGEVDLEVNKLDVRKAVATLTALAAQAGGQVANSQTVVGDDPSAIVTLRVPNDSFGTVLNRAQGLGKVLSVNTKTADVTAQYVDLSARLHALGVTKSTYLNILTKATTIGEILSVQERINDIQTQIDQLQGQLNVLNNQTTMATLTVSIDQKAKIKPAAVVHHQSGISKAVHRSVSRFVHGIEAIIGVIGPIVLVLLLIGLGWLLAKVGYRIVRRQMV